MRSPCSPARAYCEMNVSVDSRIVAFEFAYAPHDFLRLQRRRMADHLDAQKQRHQHADRQTETMKGRQRIEQDVRLVQSQMRAHLLDIRQQIPVRERDALRFALGAGSEKDHRRRRMQRVRGHQAGHESPDSGKHLVDQRELLAHIFEIDDLIGLAQIRDQRIELSQLDEAMRRHDAPDFGGLERAAQAGRAAREVQHRRNAAVCGNCKERDHRPRAGGEHDADGFTGLRATLERVTESQSRANDVFVGQDALVAVDQGGTIRAIAGTRVDQCAEHRLFGAADVKGNRFLTGCGCDARDGHISTRYFVLFETLNTTSRLSRTGTHPDWRILQRADVKRPASLTIFLTDSPGHVSGNVRSTETGDRRRVRELLRC